MDHNRPFDAHIQALKWTSRLPDLRLYLAVPEKVDYSLSPITERNRISVALKIERSRLWAFPLLYLTIQSE